MRITRVYTRTGDQGKTRLVGGQEVGKTDERIEAFGAVDELNSVLGIVRTLIQNNPKAPQILDGYFDQIQHDLFSVGGDLATRKTDRWEGMPLISEEDVTRLEGWCDELNEQLQPLKEFILPGGGLVGSHLHQARTVCRRAERRVVQVEASEQGATQESLPYLNRLSDFLFIASRWVNHMMDEAETLWQRDR